MRVNGKQLIIILLEWPYGIYIVDHDPFSSILIKKLNRILLFSSCSYDCTYLAKVGTGSPRVDNLTSNSLKVTY